jgi:hypothetical protein
VIPNRIPRWGAASLRSLWCEIPSAARVFKLPPNNTTGTVLLLTVPAMPTHEPIIRTPSEQSVCKVGAFES